MKERSSAHSSPALAKMVSSETVAIIFLGGARPKKHMIQTLHIFQQCSIRVATSCQVAHRLVHMAQSGGTL